MSKFYINALKIGIGFILVIGALLVITVSSVSKGVIQNVNAMDGIDETGLTVPQPAPVGTTWYVNSRDGNDSTGTGTSSEPFKTITHALEVASEGDTIRVEAGVLYDEVNGEVFPIRMKPGVVIQGIWIPIINGRIMPTISGGASYDIPGPTGRYVAILCADDASISGIRFISVDNPEISEPGTSILCDSTSPIIQNNEFLGDGHAGITTLGTAHPTIRDNNFTGDLNWGITVYGESYPQIESNDFSGENGVDCTSNSHPTIEMNSISCNNFGISTKGDSTPTIVNNSITGNGSHGIIVRHSSSPIIQDNLITNNPIGVTVSLNAPRPAPNPDLGGGGRSHGNNIFNNINWDLENKSFNTIMARNNRWSNSPCCEWIDDQDIYDDEEGMGEAVDFNPCIICAITPTRRPLPPVEPRGGLTPHSLNLIDCGPCPHCFERPCDPRINADLDHFLIWDPKSDLVRSFSRFKLGLEPEDGPLTAAAPLSEQKGQSIFVAAAPSADSTAADTGAVLFFDSAGETIARIDGKMPGERLGLEMDVWGDEVVVVSTQRVMRLRGGEVIHEMSLAQNLFANREVHIAFTEDIDGDKSPEILLGAPYATVVGKYREAGQIQVIGSKSQSVISALYGRTSEQHLGETLQPIDLSLQNVR